MGVSLPMSSSLPCLVKKFAHFLPFSFVFATCFVCISWLTFDYGKSLSGPHSQLPNNYHWALAPPNPMVSSSMVSHVKTNSFLFLNKVKKEISWFTLLGSIFQNFDMRHWQARHQQIKSEGLQIWAQAKQKEVPEAPHTPALDARTHIANTGFG
jgi:hypothetical protein